MLQGLVVTVPIILTVYVLWVSVAWLDVNVRELLPVVDGVPGAGILIAAAIIYGVGLLANMYLFQSVLKAAEAMINRVPLVKTLYGSVRDMLAFFGGKDKPKGEAMRVDLGDYGHMLGITTGAKDNELDRVGVYLPLSYQIGGFLVYLPREKLHTADMSVEDALKLILTGGIGADQQSANVPDKPPTP